MAQIQSPETYADGQQVTAARLNNQTNGAILLPGAVTDQTALTANTVASGDTVLLHDASASALRKATAGDLLGSGLPVTTSGITGASGVDLAITPAAGQKVDVGGDIEVEDATLTGNLTVTGSSTLTGNVIVDNGLTSNGTANFTGQLQVNGSTAYVLTEVSEETIPSFVVSSAVSRPMNAWHNGFTSSTFTKPSAEIWVFEVVLTVKPASVATTATIDHFVYASNNANSTIYYNRQGKSIGYVAQTNSASHTSELKWIVNAGTSLTSETIKLWYYVHANIDYQHTFGSTDIDATTSKTYPDSKFRIYKYKTA